MMASLSASEGRRERERELLPQHKAGGTRPIVAEIGRKLIYIAHLFVVSTAAHRDVVAATLDF